MHTNWYMNTENSTMSLRGDRASPVSSIALNPFFNNGLSRRLMGNKGYSSICGMSALEGKRSLGQSEERHLERRMCKIAKESHEGRTGRSLCFVHN